MGWSQIGADRMSKLRCYERNYGREKLIDLIRYSREQRSMKRKGTDNIAVEKVSMREIMTDHYDQSRSYIDRLQVTIPGLTAKKMASIRTNLKLLWSKKCARHTNNLTCLFNLKSAFDSRSRMQSTCLVLDLESRADRIKTAVRFNKWAINQIVDEEKGLLYTWEK